MAINISQAFHRTSAAAIDDTLTLTKAEMLTVNDNLMPAKYLTVCQDDGLIYLYDKEATPDVETGKFSVFKSGGDVGFDRVQEGEWISSTSFADIAHIDVTDFKTDVIRTLKSNERLFLKSITWDFTPYNGQSTFTCQNGRFGTFSWANDSDPTVINVTSVSLVNGNSTAHHRLLSMRMVCDPTVTKSSTNNLTLQDIVISDGSIMIHDFSAIQNITVKINYYILSETEKTYISDPWNVYVDSVNGLDTNDGTEDHPFKTLDKFYDDYNLSRNKMKVINLHLKGTFTFTPAPDDTANVKMLSFHYCRVNIFTDNTVTFNNYGMSAQGSSIYFTRDSDTVFNTPNSPTTSYVLGASMSGCIDVFRCKMVVNCKQRGFNIAEGGFLYLHDASDVTISGASTAGNGAIHVEVLSKVFAGTVKGTNTCAIYANKGSRVFIVNTATITGTKEYYSGASITTVT